MEIAKINEVINILKQYYKTFQKPIVTLLADNKSSPFQILISTMLSLRTKDKVTSEASTRLFKRTIKPTEMKNLDVSEVEKLIYPVGFYKTKAQNIIRVSTIITEKYNSQVPQEMDELLQLPGVGRKTANLVLTLGYGKLGICVDTHVHRISNRFGLIKTKNPEKTEFALREVLPKEYWIIYNDLLVSFGQNFCKPISPFCSKCKLISFCDKIGIKKSR